MSYVGFAALWCAVLLITGAINAYRYELRWPVPYWIGIAVFAAGGLSAAGSHRGPPAIAWEIVAVAGWILIAASVSGIPPRKPQLRHRRAK